MKKKLLKKLRQAISLITIASMVITVLSPFSAVADNDNEKYPYTMFAASEDDGAITINSDNFCVNGDIASNGTIVSSGSLNINGTKTENADESMIYIFDKIDKEYFNSDDIYEYEEDYNLEDTNININVPTEVMGETTLNGNINITTALKSISDINLLGEVKNTDNSVIFSKYGNITIDSSNVNINGLVYAPFGTVEISAQNLNLNNVVIIANKIIIECSSVNTNYSSNAAEFVGIESELIYISTDEWEYMTDDNDNGLPDFFEDYENWETLVDSDNDGLPDSIEDYLGTDRFSDDTDGDGLTDYYEIIGTYTEPTIADSDGNGINDGNEDFDDDGLTNIEEYNQGTKPWDSDTDDDDLSDGDEVNLYETDPLIPDTDGDELEDGDEIVLGTDPLVPDTDGDGILDSAETFFQTLTYDNDDSIIKSVSVSMEISGNINKTTTIENVMDLDILCSSVVGLVGEPFSIESDSTFDEAVISFNIDTSKLENTEFTNLLFLWYDEENCKFVELDTDYDEENGTVSVATTHFSKYLLVDKDIWVEAWAAILDYGTDDATTSESTVYNTVLAIDCSSSMSSNDPITTKTNISSAYDAKYPKTCDRIKAGESFVDHIGEEDTAGIVLFSSTANVASGLTNDTEALKLALQKVNNSGGTNFNSAISKSISLFDTEKLEAENTTNRIILLSDGQASISDTYLDLAVKKGIQIYTIGLGSGVKESVLTYIAEYTGGYYFKADTSGELVDIYVEIVEGSIDTTDTDGDGLYDVIEKAGIRTANGEIIYGCDPYSADTDGDGLLDGEEIDPEPISYGDTFSSDAWWLEVCYFKMTSDPTKVDSDDDGLEDGKNQTISDSNESSNTSNESLEDDFVIAPVDPEPMNYTGGSGLWKKYISEISSGTNTANDYLKDGDVEIDFGSDSLTDNIRLILANKGSEILDFRYDNKKIAIHSDTTQWQKSAGYNNTYDFFFALVTRVGILKLPFTYNNTDYIIWAWKGDYLNLGPGTEVGFYTKNTLTETIEDLTGFEQWIVDGTLPMTLSLYFLSDDGSYTNYYHWLPKEEQWWITGFMPDYNNYRATADELVQISSIDFSADTEMYNAFKEGLKTISYDADVICDDASHKVWIMW